MIMGSAPVDVGFGAGIVVGILTTVFMVISLVWVLFHLIAGCRIFRKMGVAGWKSLIPYYREYVLYGRVWKVSMSFVYLLTSIVGLALNRWFPNSTLLQLIALVLLVISLVVQVKCYGHLSRSFGHGKGFAAGLLLLAPIFTLILAFGSNTYQGNLYQESKNINP